MASTEPQKEMKYWIKFWSPGSFVAEDWNVNVPYLPKPEDVVWPDRAYMLTMHQRQDIIDNGKTYKGDAEQVGPRYYHPNSKVETLAEARLNPAASRILISNMECNDWNSIVWSRWGNWPQHFDASKDAVARGPA